MLFKWTLTKEIIANRLIKALPRQKFENFVRIIRMVNIRDRINGEKKMETLKAEIISKRQNLEVVIED